MFTRVERFVCNWIVGAVDTTAKCWLLLSESSRVDGLVKAEARLRRDQRLIQVDAIERSDCDHFLAETMLKLAPKFH